MKIINCKVNHINNPLGFDITRPTVTWTVTDTTAKRQESARVVVATDVNLENIIFDTGVSAELSNLGVLLSIELKPRTRYYWNVTVNADNGESATSEIQFFETGKMDEEWSAKWITPSFEDKTTHPYLRRKFSLEKNVVNARAYVVGVGLYDFYVNGEKAGDEYFAPACTVYESWIQSYTYDITSQLQKGENVIGAMLGDGWAKGHFGVFGALHQIPTDTFGLLLELQITLEDGSTVVVNSDTDWKCEKSPVVYDHLYHGEIYDARLEIADWSKASLDDSNWSNVVYHEQDTIGKVSDRLSMPIRKREEFKLELIVTKKNEYILDFGQNMAGWVTFNVNEPIDTEIKLSYTEVLQDDSFYNENLRSAKQEFIYTSKGEAVTIEPHFTYFGFRYVMVEGLTNPPKVEDFTAYAIYSDLDDTGFIHTSDDRVNRLFDNAKWSQKGNFVDVPTDCPQRDERMGWTGDAQVFSETASFNMQTYQFYKKYLKDVWEEQQYRDGMVSNFVPAFFVDKISTNENGVHGGQAIWGDVATIVPWRLYLHYGDKSILENQYSSMKAWVNWIHREVERNNSYIWSTGFQFGDWLALDGDQGKSVDDSVFGGTDPIYAATAFFMYSSEIMSRTAKVLGNKEDEVFYHELAENVRKALLNEYFTPSGRLSIKTQTGYLLALYLEIAPVEWKERIAADLVTQLEKDDMHLKTGFTGTPFLCRVLSQYGYSDVAYRIFFQDDYPSWLYEVKMGATTIWERWNSILPDGSISGTGMNSLNHYAYGSIAEWMYQSVCGLQNMEESPGFKKFQLKPQITGKLTHADLTYISPMGEIVSNWKIDGNKVTYQFTIPFDAEAEVCLQDVNTATLQCNEEVNWIELLNNEVSAVFQSGTYEITFELSRDIHEHYSFDYSMNELMSISEVKGLVFPLSDRISFLPEHLRPDLSKPFNIALSEMGKEGEEILRQYFDLEEINDDLGKYPVRKKHYNYSI